MARRKTPWWLRACPYACVGLILLALYSAFLGLCWVVFQFVPPDPCGPTTFWARAKEPSLMFLSLYAGVGLMWLVGWVLDYLAKPKDE
jgi:cytochrome b561